LDAAGLGGTRTWTVRFRGNALIVSPAAASDIILPFVPEIDTATMGSYGAQPAEALHVRDTWLLAYYHGEFGGALWQFTNDGSVGHMLLGAPTYGLTRYGNDVLAETGSAAPFFLPPLRIHRYALRGTAWQEVSHADYRFNIVRLTNIAGALYGMAGVNQTAWLARIDLNGRLQYLWPASRYLNVRNIAMSRQGDFAIGATGYVIELRRRGDRFDAIWYAPRDCVRYTRSADDSGASDARCIGAPGVQSYAHQSWDTPRNAAVSADGTWILPCCSRVLLHFDLGRWTTIPLPFNGYHWRIVSRGDDVLVPSSGGIWLKRAGRWTRIAPADACANWATLAQDAVWCFAQVENRAGLRRVGFGGAITDVRLDAEPEFLMAASDGVWFTERAQPDVFHADLTGRVERLRVSFAVTSLSASNGNLWFSDDGGARYGFIDAMHGVHEVTPQPKPSIQWVHAARVGAWLQESYLAGKTIVHVSANPSSPQFGARGTMAEVTSDGALWALSDAWPTIVRVTETGDVTSYRLPCPGRTLHFEPPRITASGF